MVHDIIKGEINADWETSERGNFLTVYEPLNTDATESMRPFCCHNNTIIFYEKKVFSNEYSRADYRIKDGYHNHFYKFKELYYEYASSLCVWHNGAWHMKHLLIKRNPQTNGTTNS